MCVCVCVLCAVWWCYGVTGPSSPASYHLRQEEKGYVFESDTDTEVIPKLTKYLYDTQCKEEQLPFNQLVEQVVFQLVRGGVGTLATAKCL